MICVYCKKKLVPIGSARRKGASFDDWEKRDCHKKCAKEHNLADPKWKEALEKKVIYLIRE